MNASKLTNLVVLDLETTGVNPFENDVIALAMVPMLNFDPLLVYVRLDNLNWGSEFARQNFERFRCEWETKAVSCQAACEQIESYLRDTFNSPATPVGHNVGFDVSFMKKLAHGGGRSELAGLSHRAIDTHTLLFSLYVRDKIPDRALSSDGAFRHFGIEVPEAKRHTALGDALATRELFRRLIEML